MSTFFGFHEQPNSNTANGSGRPPLYQPVPRNPSELRPMSLPEVIYHIRYFRGPTYICLKPSILEHIGEAIAIPIVKGKLLGLIEGLSKTFGIPFTVCVEDGNLCVFIDEVVASIQNSILHPTDQDIWIPGASHTATQHTDQRQAEQPMAQQPQQPQQPLEPDFMAFPTVVEAKKALIAFKWPDLLMHWHYLTEITLDEDDQDLMNILEFSQLRELQALEDAWYVHADLKAQAED